MPAQMETDLSSHEVPAVFGVRPRTLHNRLRMEAREPRRSDTLARAGVAL